MSVRDEHVVNVTPVQRRTLPAQPVLRIASMWDPTDPDSGAGADLARIREAMTEQGLEQAGTPYVCIGEPEPDGRVRGESVVPVDRPGKGSGPVEAVTQPETTVVSLLYRDDIHLTAGPAARWQLAEEIDNAGLERDGQPRWIYHTHPAWNLRPDDHLIELAWPTRTPSA